jgi:hypothetical protein
MYIFTPEQAQKDLPKVLELVAQGKDVGINGKHPVLLSRVRGVGNLTNGDPETCASMIIDWVDDDLLDDEALKPLPDDIIESFYAPKLYDAPTPAPESR